MVEAIKKVVLADLDVAIFYNIDGWNDYLCYLTDEPLLQDIDWKVIGSLDGMIQLEVSGIVNREGVEDGDSI